VVLTGIYVEHKGVSNRLLVKLGWIKVIRGNRDSPRNSDVTLQDTEILLRRHRELMCLRKEAVGFIRCVFQSSDILWVERCTMIIKEV
jgi:hypothetical protein